MTAVVGMRDTDVAGHELVPLGKWLHVQELTTGPQRKTKIWRVIGSDGSMLGQIRWYSHWRQYTFWPEATAVLNATCLHDIATFAHTQTEAHVGG